MNHNYKLKGVHLSSLTRRVGWLGLIATLGCGLLCLPLIRESVAQSKVPPRTPQKQQVEIEKKTGVEKNAVVIMQQGILKGRIYQANNQAQDTLHDPNFVWSKRPVPDAFTITVGQCIAASCQVHADNHGDYLVNGLKPGKYKVVMTIKRSVRKNLSAPYTMSKIVTVRANETTTLNFGVKIYIEDPFL
jgi:hypothetical protein